MMNFGPVPFVPWGTSRRFGRNKTHNQKAPITPLGRTASRSKTSQFSGAVTRISGDPSWNSDFGKYMEWAAVDTLVKLTKGNVDAAHTS